MNTLSAQQKDFNLKDLLSDLWNNRKIIIICVLLCLSIAIAYLIITPNTFKASSTLLPFSQIEARGIKAALPESAISTKANLIDISFIIMQSFEKNFVSHGLIIEHSKKFFKEGISEAKEQELTSSVKLSSNLNTTQKTSPITVSFSYTNPQVALKWLNSYIKFIEDYTRAEIKNSVDANLQSEVEQYNNILNNKHRVAALIKTDKIVRLEEALLVAKKAGIIQPQIGNLENLNEYEYLKGTKILNAEIEILKQSKNTSTFPSDYYELKEKLLTLQGTAQSLSKFNFFTSSEEASTASFPIYPKKAVVVIFSIFMGLVLGIFISLLKTYLKLED